MNRWIMTARSEAADLRNRFLQSKSIRITTLACWISIGLQIAVFPPATSPTWSLIVSWLLIVLDSILTLLIPLWPTHICAILLALHSVLSLLPAQLTWASLLEFPALAFLSYRCAFPCAFGIVMWLSIVQVLSNLLGSMPDGLLWGAVSFFPLGFIAFMSASLRQSRQSIMQKDQLMAQERAIERQRQLEHNRRLATAIHDSITKELSTILLITGAWEFEESVDADRIHKDMKSIHRETKRALNQMHRVIDLIDDNQGKATRGTTPSDTLIDLEKFLESETDSASAIGFEGTVHLSGKPQNPIDDLHLMLVEGFLKEIFANILRHAEPGRDSYSMDISIVQNSIHITQTNRTGSGITASSEFNRLRHGRGLQSHRQAIITAGGTVQYRLHGGQWHLQARIPCNDAANQTNLAMPDSEKPLPPVGDISNMDS